MIEFKELRVSNENKCIIVDVEIIGVDNWENIGIDAIRIESQDTYNELNQDSISPVYESDLNSYKKSVQLLISQEDLDNVGLKADILKDLFYVTVSLKGSYPANTPEEFKMMSRLGVVFNTYPVYADVIKHLQNTSKCCEIPDTFVDYILKYKAFEVALKAGHWPLANKYWNKFFKKSIKTCKCYE